MISRFNFILFVIFCSCGIDNKNNSIKSLDYSELKFKNDIGYFIGKPYSGQVFSSHPNGKRRFQSTFVKGLGNGEFIEWDTLGRVLERSNYKLGRLHGSYTRYYPSGEKHFQTEYIDGSLESEAFEWHENGQLKIKMHYKNSFLNGEYTLWNNQGQKLLNGKMLTGERHGEWYEHNDILNKTFINYYDKGEVIKSETQH